MGVAFLSLFISLLGISYFLTVLLAERNSLVEYLTWLQHELTTHCCHWEAKFEPSPQPPGAATAATSGSGGGGGGNSLSNNDGPRMNGRVAAAAAAAQQHNHSQHSLSEEEVSPTV